MKQEHLLHAIVGESLIPYIESSFLWFANIEVSRDRANAVRIRRPEWRDEDAHRRPPSGIWLSGRAGRASSGSSSLGSSRNGEKKSDQLFQVEQLATQGTGIEQDISHVAWPTTEETSKKRSLDPPGGERAARRRKGLHHTMAVRF